MLMTGKFPSIFMRPPLEPLGDNEINPQILAPRTSHGSHGFVCVLLDPFIPPRTAAILTTLTFERQFSDGEWVLSKDEKDR